MKQNDTQLAHALDLRFLDNGQDYSADELDRLERTGFPKESVSGKKEFLSIFALLFTAAVASPFVTLAMINLVAGFKISSGL